MTALIDAQREFRDELLRAGVLISMGVDGLYGKSGVYERVIERINAAVTEVGGSDKPEIMRFPPGIGLWSLEKSGYLKSFPQLAGTVHSFMGNEKDHRALIETMQNKGDWTSGQKTTSVALTPAACYSVYPTLAARGPLPANGGLVDVYSFCFRHEPSIDPVRMQMFRMREYVRIGTAEQALEFRELWFGRGRKIFDSFGLPFDVDVANDPFFGRTGKMLAESQRGEELKFELLVPINSRESPTACMSFNYHRDLFGNTWGLATHDGEPAHTACVAFGEDRIALALFKHHGTSVEKWPGSVRQVFGL